MTLGKGFGFESNEELHLIGVHQLNDILFLIFLAGYEPGRGFVIYQAKGSAPFVPMPTTELPIEAAVANYGSYQTERKILLGSSERMVLETMTARLWSQIATGKPYLPWGIDEARVREIWQNGKWRRALGSVQVVQSE
ncbi:MAG TPA: hypothetical protein VD994_06175 [Prosthecobacter sp.]|nr:hypothetical protein [Prosthecobacter sp.]